jgi:pseudouridine-5'-phosphate glycosidase
MGMPSAVLVTQPIPAGDEIPKSEMDAIISQASKESLEARKSGQELTPFLLQSINTLTNGRSLHANLSLLLNNARLGAQIAKEMAILQRQKNI